MSGHPLSPNSYAIENDRWVGQLVSVGGEDAIIGSFSGTQKVRQARIFHRSAADHTM